MTTAASMQTAVAIATVNKKELLDLPLEMIQSITDHLGSEALMQVRQTCKTLDSATFDRFSSEHFSNIVCFILSEARWKQLKAMLNSARLANKFKVVTFNTDCLEGAGQEAIHVAPIWEWWLYHSGPHILPVEQSNFYERLREGAARQSVSFPLMTSVLMNLSHRQEHIRTCLELLEYDPELVQHDPNPRHSALLSIVAAVGLKPSSVALSTSCLVGMAEHGEHLRPELLCSSKLQEFSFGRSSHSMCEGMEAQIIHAWRTTDFATGVLEAAKDLSILKIDGSERLEFDNGMMIARRPLRANPALGLTELHLVGMIISEKDLIEALAKQKQLIRIELSEIHLTDIAIGGWPKVFQCLYAKKERLQCMHLSLLITYFETSTLVWSLQPGEQREQWDLNYTGEEEVAAALKDLAG